MLRPRPEIEKLEICPHGGLNHAELAAMGLNPENVLDFSVCTNPFMPPPGINEFLSTVALNQYPDSEATRLRERLAEKDGLSMDSIIVGSGTTELIRLIALAYFGAGDSALILEPTFGEYEVACRIAGARVIKHRAGEKDSFNFKAKEIADCIKRFNPRGVFICNPNNPTGKYITRKDVETVLSAVNGLIVLDEAYVSFVDKSWSSTDLLSSGKLIILRSMTKDYGLAGLRLGYALACKEIIATLRRLCPPWNVNIMAQAAGIFALGATDYLAWSLEQVRELKQFLADELSRRGFQLVPSDVHYFLVKVINAQTFRAALLKRGALVRDCTSFGLPDYIRISPRTMAECRQFLDIASGLKDEAN